MDALRSVFFLATLCSLVGSMRPGELQAQSVDLGGLAYLDYYYIVSSPVPDEDDLHGFTYRRLYLTADYRLSDDFFGRARLEANDGTTASIGPVPFVKDLYLSWEYSGRHFVTLGIQPPPAFEISESVFGYRSLEKTILDFQGIVGSRDFGVRFDGPLLPGGTLRYSAMLANNSSTRPEDDSYKRGYVQLAAFPIERLSLVLGADHAGDDGAIESRTRLSGSIGYAADSWRIGTEGFWSNAVAVDEDELATTGISVYGSVRFLPEWEVVARVDRGLLETPGTDVLNTFILGGISYAPNEFVRLIPNIWILKYDVLDESRMLGRFTAEVTF